MLKQRGVVLFFALIALVAMSLAAVALIRSVDTSTLIAGNLAFKQATKNSAEAGVEAAIAWLDNANAQNGALNVYMNPDHPFNRTGGFVTAFGSFQNNGYYSYADPNLSLTDSSAASHLNWDDNDSTLVGTDGSGNTTRYVIQRMCRDANVEIANNNCLFSDIPTNNNNMVIPLPQNYCKGPGCPPAAQPPQIRITARSEGPKNTVSYVQAFVF